MPPPPPPVFVAFADMDDAADAALARPGAANIPSYSRLFGQRPAYQFRVLPVGHEAYDRLPDTPLPGITAAMQWHRPRATTLALLAGRGTLAGITSFPWQPQQRIVLFRDDTHEYAATAELQYFSGTGREATGIIAADLVDVNGMDEGTVYEFDRAFTATAMRSAPPPPSPIASPPRALRQ